MTREWQSSVKATEACPNRSKTNLAWTPVPGSNEPWVCRASCSRVRSRPHRFTDYRKAAESESGGRRSTSAPMKTGSPFLSGRPRAAIDQDRLACCSV